MASNYDFLFKFIIIGDSSKENITEVLGNLVSCEDLHRIVLSKTTNQLEAFNLVPGIQESTIEQSKYKYGIQELVNNDRQGNNLSKLLLDHTIRGTCTNKLSSIAAFLVYDVTKRDSFENINKWLYEVKSHSHEKVEVVLVGNKSDMKDKREVSYEEGEKFAQVNGFMFFETSAQTGEKVEEAFKTVAKKIVTKIETKDINPDAESSYGLRRGKKTKKEQGSKGGQTLVVPSQQQANEEKKSCCGK